LKNLFVGNLSSNLTPDELRTLFQTYGAVEEIEIITNPNTRYSRGFAFVEMTNDMDAINAIASLNGTTVWGNPLKVEEAKPKLERHEELGNRHAKDADGSAPE
jgi:RNA recognition motif-containing protein